MNWIGLKRRSAIFRKGLDVSRQFPRNIKRRLVKQEEYLCFPPLVGNSFPKSGTHQLLQVLSAFPEARHWGGFIASMPSITFRERSAASHIRKIEALIPREYLGGHIFYDEDYARSLEQMNAVHFFIYRDLRDVAVSEMYYLRDMNRWHRLHNYFTDKLRNDDDRLMAVIKGIDDPKFAYDYPDISIRMSRYLPWITKDCVFSLKYEDLNSEHRELLIREMINFYCKKCSRDVDEDEIVSRAFLNLDPSRSHTFRSGGSGGWRKVFRAKHEAVMQELCGPLLNRLGYDD